jgi:hypothetical protein
MLLEQQPASYDYKTAFTNLQRKIQLLSSIKEQHQGQSSPLGRSLYFFRQHRGSLLLLFAMYSMSTASVVSAIMAEKRLQVSHQQQQQQQQQHHHHRQLSLGSGCGLQPNLSTSFAYRQHLCTSCKIIPL